MDPPDLRFSRSPTQYFASSLFPDRMASILSSLNCIQPPKIYSCDAFSLYSILQDGFIYKKPCIFGRHGQLKFGGATEGCFAIIHGHGPVLAVLGGCMVLRSSRPPCPSSAGTCRYVLAVGPNFNFGVTAAVRFVHTFARIISVISSCCCWCSCLRAGAWVRRPRQPGCRRISPCRIGGAFLSTSSLNSCS